MTLPSFVAETAPAAVDDIFCLHGCSAANCRPPLLLSMGRTNGTDGRPTVTYPAPDTTQEASVMQQQYQSGTITQFLCHMRQHMT